jgi:hypothetical protein
MALPHYQHVCIYLKAAPFVISIRFKQLLNDGIDKRPGLAEATELTDYDAVECPCRKRIG